MLKPVCQLTAKAKIYMHLSTLITQGKSQGTSFDYPPTYNSKVNKKYKPQQGKVDNRSPHMDLIDTK